MILKERFESYGIILGARQAFYQGSSVFQRERESQNQSRFDSLCLCLVRLQKRERTFAPAGSEGKELPLDLLEAGRDEKPDTVLRELDYAAVGRLGFRPKHIGSCRHSHLFTALWVKFYEHRSLLTNTGWQNRFRDREYHSHTGSCK